MAPPVVDIARAPRRPDFAKLDTVSRSLINSPPGRTIVSSTVLSVLSGFPVYLGLDSLGWLPLALRDRPWPLEIISGGAGLMTFVLAWRTVRRGGNRSGAIACAVGTLAFFGWFVWEAHFYRYRLPPPAAELALGVPVDFTLADESGQPVRLSSLRGHPTLLYFYRGSW
ncbi:MAG TPA: hypothetical protein VE782_06095 [Myxococcaceae bacterium]|nr:hypothetical protein [Myxococcaceae bacterium]